jgi:hypothetical protein
MFIKESTKTPLKRELSVCDPDEEGGKFLSKANLYLPEHTSQHSREHPSFYPSP